MEKDNEVVKKSGSDLYSSKRVDVSRTNFIRNNTRLSTRSDTSRKGSYTSRGKNVSSPVNRKYGFYGSQTKSFFKHSCDKYGIRCRSHLILSSGSAISSPSDVTLAECGRDFNGNISFNTHPPTLYNFASSVSEISTLNKVLSYQSSQHYELSLSNCSKITQRTPFSEQKTFSSKVAYSNNSFNSNRVFQSFPNSTIRCHCSEGVSESFAFPGPHFKSIDKPSYESITANKRCNPKYDKYPESNVCLDSNNKLTDLPVFFNNSHKNPSMTCKVDCFEEQLQIKKQRSYSSKKWNRIPIMSEFGKSSKYLEKSDKMLFPALPSNSHCQQGKLNSSMPPFEQSLVENSNLEVSHSLSGGNAVLNASVLPSPSTSTPQASYADVIRMSTACSGVQDTIVDHEKSILEPNPLLLINNLQDKLPKDENSQASSSDWMISRLPQLDLNSPEPTSNVAIAHCYQNGQNFVAPRPIVVSLEKPSFYNSSLQTCKNVLNTISSNTTFLPIDKKVVENGSSANDCLNGLEKSSVDNSVLPGSTSRSSVSSDFTTSMTDTQMNSVKTDSVYSSPSSVSSYGDTFKSVENKKLNINLLKRKPPVIIMNSCLPPDSMSEISFGIEYEEMVKLCSDNCAINITPLAVQDIENCLHDENIKIDYPHKKSVVPILFTESISPSSDEIPYDKRISLKSKTLYWKESDVNYNRKNHKELAEYLCGVWIGIDKEMKKDKEVILV
ncbi:uncharacterized protein TNCT_707651 [Trichonephila clavata]|uniref:Uncharacterized protein n=1 Tax=Trichonephila clavata TaxID=2740835 RepID=A0A8X6GS94_TRICU|nr:uncharacterized protein TNCT_707651 [Trichonephila clavata]